MNRGRFHRRTSRVLFVSLYAAGVLAAIHLATYFLMTASGWHDSWEYITRSHQEEGVSPRESTTGGFGGTRVIVNADGVRDISENRRVAKKSPNERLIFVAGDSNTFGNGVWYRQTFGALLEKKLQRRSRRPVRVINLGVPGHSLAQTLIRVKRWAARKPDLIIVTADSYNNRAFLSDTGLSPGTPSLHYRRVYEFGGTINYPLLFLYHHLIWKPALEDVPIPSMSAPIPPSRLTPSRYEATLQALISFADRHGIAMLLLEIGDGIDSARVQEGHRAMTAGDWKTASKVFSELGRSDPRWFLTTYYVYLSEMKLGHRQQARKLERNYAWRIKQEKDKYLHFFAAFADAYSPILHDVADRNGTPIVDVRPAFTRNQVDFHSVCHFGRQGHAIIAEALYEQIMSTNLLRDSFSALGPGEERRWR